MNTDLIELKKKIILEQNKRIKTDKSSHPKPTKRTMQEIMDTRLYHGKWWD